MDDDEDMVHGSEGLNDFYGFNPNDSDISQLSDMDFTDNESNNDGGCEFVMMLLLVKIQLIQIK